MEGHTILESALSPVDLIGLILNHNHIQLLVHVRALLSCSVVVLNVHMLICII